jgi:hypothetical protein
MLLNKRGMIRKENAGNESDERLNNNYADGHRVGAFSRLSCKCAALGCTMRALLVAKHIPDHKWVKSTASPTAAQFQPPLIRTGHD